ncbi:hypothetical protein RR48_08704 [Papilio machaon]|uniref:Uncharacterized protein n=1 Tax=Papilio machaon TaxID=76193 RepID=A0A194R9F2_PAPMA|nr:hypothetical protein RR48_08704 [Papilio machaon]
MEKNRHKIRYKIMWRSYYARIRASPRHAGLTARRQTAEQAAVSALLRPSALAPHDSRFDPTHTHPAFPAVRRSQTVIN